jgi:hypothetical protein
MSDPVSHLLVAAAELAGGAEALARYLHISPKTLRLYIDGERRLPDFLLLRTVDLVLAGGPQPSKEQAEQPEATASQPTPRAA